MKLRLPLFLLSALASADVASAGVRGGNGARVLQEAVEGTYLLADIQYEDGVSGPEEKDNIELLDGTILELVNTGLPPGQAKRQLASGSDHITLPPGTVISNGKADLRGNPPTKVENAQALFDRDLEEERTPEQERNLAELRRQLRTGTYTVLAVRVLTSDGAYSGTEAHLSNKVFGTSGDAVNLKSQYTACSHGALNFVEANDRTSSQGNISNGVVTVQVNNPTSDGDGVIRNAVNAKLNTMFGVSSPNQLANHVMHCLPSGAMGGIAYAYINSWNSVYKDVWCEKPSAQLHEIGHNINLAHSNEGTTTYADQSGMMGYSYSNDEGPLMCFNNAKNWQLGWYANGGTMSLSTAASFDETLTLKGIADYAVGMSEWVVVQITGSTTEKDLYIGFNRKKGFNAGTVEGGNQVTIQERNKGTGYAESTLLAKLNAGDSYTFTRNQDTGTVTYVQALTSDEASVRVQWGAPTTPQPTNQPTTPPPTNQPTTAPPTDQPTPPPTPSPTVSAAPSKAPSKNPTKAPSPSPTGQPTFPPVSKYVCHKNDPGTADICANGLFLDGTCSEAGAGCGNGGKVCHIATCPGTGPAPTPPSPTPEPNPTPTPPGPAPGPCDVCGDGTECCNGTCETSGKPEFRTCIV